MPMARRSESLETFETLFAGELSDQHLTNFGLGPRNCSLRPCAPMVPIPAFAAGFGERDPCLGDLIYLSYVAVESVGKLLCSASLSEVPLGAFNRARLAG